MFLQLSRLIVNLFLSLPLYLFPYVQLILGKENGHFLDFFTLDILLSSLIMLPKLHSIYSILAPVNLKPLDSSTSLTPS